MTEENKLVPRENGSNGAIDLLPLPTRLPVWDLSRREPHLYDYLLILRKHQWMILSFLLAVVTIVAIATFRMQPVYIATTRIELDRENANILPFPGTDSYDVMMDQDNYIETQSKILTSETLALQTIRNNALSARPEFSSPNGPSEAVALGSLANQKRPPELGEFLKSLMVKRVPNSHLMDVSFEATDPQLAARIVNAHISSYIEQNFRSKYEATTRATTWLTDQLTELKIRVQKAEDARIAYERQNQIWTLDDKQNITTQRLGDINRQLTEAQSERMKKESLYQFAKSGNLDAVPQIQSNPTLTELFKKRGEVSSEYTDALNQYGPNFPKVQRLQAQLKDYDQSIEKGKKNVLDVLESDYREAQQRESLLMQALDQQKTETNQMAERLVEYNTLMREYLDNTVKNPDDVESLARLPSLAVVAQFTGSNGAGKRSGPLLGFSSNGHDRRIELVAHHLPKSQWSEAFRALRTSILLSQADHPPQVILVTSALPREGKTTTAANLAVTLAQLGDSTVIVDGDLRKPGIGRLLNMDNGKYAGLSSYLAGVSSLDLVSVPHPAIPNLVTIPTGPLPPNPADLLSSHRLVEAIAELRTKYKFIIIDSPPIMAATDAVILSVQTDGVLLVVRSGETPKVAFTRTRDLLSSVKCRILGVVLNAVDSSAPDYYYSYRYYPYSYGYGPQEAAEAPHEEDSEAISQRVSRDRDDDSEAL